MAIQREDIVASIARHYIVASAALKDIHVGCPVHGCARNLNIERLGSCRIAISIHIRYAELQIGGLSGGRCGDQADIGYFDDV